MKKNYYVMQIYILRQYKKLLPFYMPIVLTMFTMQQIKPYFPPEIRQDEYMLKEYLQYKILHLIFRSKYAYKLVFI